MARAGMEPISAKVLEDVVELVTEEVDMGDLGGGATQQGGCAVGGREKKDLKA
jgi:hypothetical protein